MKNRSICARLAVLFLSVVTLTLASTVNAQVTQLNPVVITASRMPQSLSDVLADVSIIDRETLQNAGLQSLGDVLASLPGVQLVTNGSYRSSTNLSLRGASASQTILLVNGIRMGSATLGSFSLENLPLERIERVEVLRGAAAALYGPDAVGGVIQIFTREPVDGLQRSVTAGLGSDGQGQLGVSLSGRSGAWGYSLGASHERADGINVKTPIASGFNKDKDGFRNTSVDGSLQWKLSELHELNLNAVHSEGEYDFDGAPFPTPAGTNAGNLRAFNVPSMRQLSLDWAAKWTPSWSSNLKIGQSKDLSPSRYLRESDNTSAGESRFNTHRQQFSWQNNLRIGNDSLSLIAEHRLDEVDSSTPYTVRERAMRGFVASYSKRADGWDALLTARHDQNSQFGNFNTWSVSGGYKLNSDWRLVGNVGTTFQAPSFNQLYFPGFGNTALKPQEGKSQEIGIRYSAGSQRAGMVIYQNDVQGFINTATNVQSSLAVLKGATFNWDRSWSDTRLSTSYDYADPRLKPTNARVSRVARNLVRAQLNHRIGPWTPFAELRLSGDRFDSASNLTLPGYGVVNMGTSYRWDKNWRIVGRLNNLGDKTYSLANGFTTPGRYLFVSLQWTD